MNDAPDRRPTLGDLIAGVGLVVILGILAVQLVPTTCRNWRTKACSSNLAQLYKMSHLYALEYPRARSWPEGDELWLAMTRVQPPLVEGDLIDMLLCPVEGEDALPNHTDYRGPAGQLRMYGLDDPIGADKPGNHGPGCGGNALRKDGTVHELQAHDLDWRRCEELLRP